MKANVTVVHAAGVLPWWERFLVMFAPFWWANLKELGLRLDQSLTSLSDFQWVCIWLYSAN
jgi:hypothetical protein